MTIRYRLGFTASIFAGFVATVVALSASSLAGPPAASPPATVQDAICRPQFTVDGVEGAELGTGFLFDSQRKERGLLLLSANHLFGPDGGLPEVIPWDQLAKHVSGIRCTAMTSDQVWHGGVTLTIPGAHPISQAEVQDISAFPLSPADLGGKATPLKLAAKNPALGDSVWLVAQVLEGAPPTQLLHHAVVVYTADDVIDYVFDNSKLIIRATSGAPVVNAAGELVGINLSGGVQKSGKHAGKFLAEATAVGSIKKSIATAY